MVLFGCPVQPRTACGTGFAPQIAFWKSYGNRKLVNISKNDSDRYQFAATDQKNYLNTLSIQGFGYLARKDIQIW
jgi:hypothetical protein